MSLITWNKWCSGWLTVATLYCVMSVCFWQGSAVIRGSRTAAHLFFVHIGSVTSEKIVVHLPTAAKYKENRKLQENFPLVQFPTSSYTKLEQISHCGADLTGPVVTHMLSFPDLPNVGLVSLTNKVKQRSWLICFYIKRLNQFADSSNTHLKKEN